MPCTSALCPTAPLNWECTLQTSPTSYAQELLWTWKLPPGKSFPVLNVWPLQGHFALLIHSLHGCWDLSGLVADDG